MRSVAEIKNDMEKLRIELEDAQAEEEEANRRAGWRATVIKSFKEKFTNTVAYVQDQEIQVFVPNIGQLSVKEGGPSKLTELLIKTDQVKPEVVGKIMAAVCYALEESKR